MADLILFRACHSQALKELINRSSPGDIVAINIDTDVLFDDWEHNLHFVRPANYLSTKEIDTIGIDSLRLAQSWYKIDGIDLTYAKGLSFGEYIEYQLNGVLTVACLQIAFLDRFSPARILMIDDGSLIGLVTKAYAENNGIPLHIESPDKVSDHVTDWYGPINVSSDDILKNAMKKLICLTSQLLGKKATSESLTFFVEQHQYTMSFMDLVLKKTNHRIICESIPRKFIGHPRLICLYNAPLNIMSESMSTFRQLLDSLNVALEKSDSFRYYGIELWPLIKGLYLREFINSWKEFYGSVDRYVFLLTHFQISAVLVLQDQVSIPRLIVMLAKKLGIPSVFVGHGIAGYTALGIPEPYADIRTYFGDSCKLLDGKQHILNTEVQSVAIGEDSFGHIKCRVSKIDRTALCSKLGLISEPIRNVLFISDCYQNYSLPDHPSDQNVILYRFCQAISELENVNVIIRFHPCVEVYERMAPKLNILRYFGNDRVFADKNLTLDESLALSDIVVVGASSVGLQAIAAHKPLVIFDPLRRDPVRYIEEHAGAAAFSEVDLLKVVKQLLSDSRFEEEVCSYGQEFIRSRVTGYGDGMACERLLSVILRFVGKTVVVG